jgi:hypothetical protein
MSSSLIRDPAHALRFLLAGNAYTTFVSGRTGTRFTFHVRAKPTASTTVNDVSHFVSVLTGPDTYEYLGCIYKSSVYMHGTRSKIGSGAESAMAFAWVWRWLSAGKVPRVLDVYHEGRCGRCGRRLTTPESIIAGVGPECFKKIANA